MGKSESKSDVILGIERERKKQIQRAIAERESLKFKAQMEGDHSHVLKIETWLSLRISSSPGMIINCIVYFRHPMDREDVERRIRNAFKL